ncbi:MAG: 50S ribosomal protein L30e [Candidatus Diapherotrites archaeon]|nr:50S ribosomal protein L30e [Candidatus Diapherotrites archaeon]
MDANKEIRRAVDTGKIVFGFKETEKESMIGKAKMIILAKNIEQDKKEKMENYSKIGKIPIYSFEGTAKELGAICGKPFHINTLAVLDKGKSDVLKLTAK